MSGRIPGMEDPRYLVVGVEFKTPIDVARDLDRALAYYSHVFACFAEQADFARRDWLCSRTRPQLEEIAARGDEGAGLELERRRAGKWLWRAVEMAARANVRMNVPAFDPDRPLGPGSMVRWARHGPLDYAGRIDPRRYRFKLGEWAENIPTTRGGNVKGSRVFQITDQVPWHDPRVPGSGEEAEVAMALGRHPTERPKLMPIDPELDGAKNARARVARYAELMEQQRKKDAATAATSYTEAQVKGMTKLKRALEVGPAGGHNPIAKPYREIVKTRYLESQGRAPQDSDED